MAFDQSDIRYQLVKNLFWPLQPYHCKLIDRYKHTHTHAHKSHNCHENEHEPHSNVYENLMQHINCLLHNWAFVQPAQPTLS